MTFFFPKGTAVPRCRTQCNLNRTCRSPKMKPTGGGKRGVLFIAEAPGAQEDARGTQLIGAAGQALRDTLRTLHFDLDHDARKTNAVTCRPPKNRQPKSKEIEACRPHVFSELADNPAKVVILLGGTALESYFGDRVNDLGGITRWRGFSIPDYKHNTWVCPTFHPSYVLREKEHLPVVPLIFRRDLKRALGLISEPLPKRPLMEVEVVREMGKVAVLLRGLLHAAALKPFLMAFDYETTGLKPYREGHDIISCAFARSTGPAYAFLLKPEIRDLWCQVLRCKAILKIASNMKFEEIWGRVILKTRTAAWKGDTMLGAHVSDNRKGVTGIKFLSAVHFGIFNYNEEVAPFLKATGKEEKKYGANAFNRIRECPVSKLLHYNGLDSLMEMWEWLLQRKHMT